MSLQAFDLLNDEKFASYICLDCEAILDKYLEQCPECGAIGSIELIKITPKLYDETFGIYDKYEFEHLDDIVNNTINKQTVNNKIISEVSNNNSEFLNFKNQFKIISCENLNFKVSSYKSGIIKFDLLFGNNLIAGSFNVILGRYNSGKTSFFIKIAECYANKGYSTFFISLNESFNQISNRLKNLDINSSNLFVVSANDVKNVLQNIKHHQPKIIFLDSLSLPPVSFKNQNNVEIFKNEFDYLFNFAKENNIVLFVIINSDIITLLNDNKDISYVLDMSDTLISFESLYQDVKMLRVIKGYNVKPNTTSVFNFNYKNVTSITDKVYSSVLNCMLNNDPKWQIGSTCSVYENNGTLIFNEVEVIVSKISANPKINIFGGISSEMLTNIITIVEKYNDIYLNDKNIYIKIKGPAYICDSDFKLSIAAALLSSCYEIPILNQVIFLGDISYSGEILPAQINENILKQIMKLGFKTFVSSNLTKQLLNNISDFKVNCYNVSNIKDLRNVLVSISNFNLSK